MLYILDKRTKRDKKVYCTVYDTDDNSIETLYYDEVIQCLDSLPDDVEVRHLDNYKIKDSNGVILMYPQTPGSFLVLLVRDKSTGKDFVAKTQLCGTPSYRVEHKDNTTCISITCKSYVGGLINTKVYRFSSNFQLLEETRWIGGRG